MTSLLNLKILTFAFVVSVLTLSCKKDPPTQLETLPPATQEGKNTFGCLINGEAFIAGVEYSLFGPTSMNGFFNENTLYFGLQGTKELSQDVYEKVYFNSYVLNGKGFYQVEVIGGEDIGYDSQASACEYYHDQENPGILQITRLDTEENIISGSFQFQLKNPTCSNDSLMTISEGRFDFRY